MANDHKKNTKQFICSLGWYVVVLPIMGLLNPFWLLNPSFPNNWDSNKEIISNTILSFKLEKIKNKK